MPSRESRLGDKKPKYCPAEVVNNAADTPGSFTEILGDSLGGLLKASPRGFSSDRLYHEFYQISPNTPKLIDLSYGNNKKIWLCPLVPSRKPPKVEATDDIFLNLRLRLGDIDIHMINKIASHLQSLPHVNEIRFEDLNGPKEEIGNFIGSVVQAAKLRPLMRKLYARRELRKLKELSENGRLMQSQLRLRVDPSHHIPYDWYRAMERYSHRSAEHSVSPHNTLHCKKRRLS